MTDDRFADYVVAGKIGAAHGIEGWVRLYSYMDPARNILNYRDFCVHDGEGLRKIEIDRSKAQGKGFVGHIVGCDDREQARMLTGRELLLAKKALPEPASGEYYWHQLEGLRVVSLDGDDFGVVDHLMETGANDVLVVAPDEASIDDRQRLIPFVKGRMVESVDLDRGLIRVDWEKDWDKDY